jgi:cyclic pyranopterin monophosphate synthase
VAPRKTTARNPKASPLGSLTHVDETGKAAMVNVGQKAETARIAVASSCVRMSKETLQMIEQNAGKKGDVLAVSRIAGLAALKRTADLIPLCHPVRVVGSDLQLQLDPQLPGVRVLCTVEAFDRTGVEMEAMVGASAAALTIYDMVKGVERGVTIESVALQQKSGGRSGLWKRPLAPLKSRS